MSDHLNERHQTNNLSFGDGHLGDKRSLKW